MIALTCPRYPLSVMLAVARVLFLLFLTFAAVVQAEEADELTSNPVALTLMDTVEKKLEALEAEDSTGDKSTEQLSALYRKAISNLQSAASYDQTTAGYILAHTDAPAQTEKLAKRAQEISATDAMGDKGEFGNLSLKELEPILLKKKADHAAFEANLTKNLETLKYHTKRPQIIRQRLIEANIEAEGIADELQQAVNVNETTAMQEAGNWVRESRAFVISSEINALNEELLSHLPRIQLIKAKIKQAESNTSYVQGRLERLEQLINNKRSAKASRVQLETARSELNTEGQHHLLRQLAESNTELSQQISKNTLDLKQVEEEAELIDQQAKQIGQDFKKAQQKLDIAGMSKILGRVLQEQRGSLPDTRLSRKKVKQLEEKIADVSLQQLEYKDEHQKLRDLDAYAESYMLEAGVVDIPQLTGQVHNLLTDRNEYLSQLISIQSAYVRALSELDFSQTRLLDAASRYDDFLAKNLLWIRNVGPVSLSNVNAIPGQVHGLLSLASWQAVIVTLWQQAGSNPTMVLILALAILLLWKRPHMLVALKATGNTVGKPSKDGIRFTLYGFMWTFLLAMAWPLLLMGSGWQLQNAISTDVFTKAVSLALIRTSEALLILRMFALLCSRYGVASRHFKWPAKGLKSLQRDINLLMFTFLPLGFIAIIIMNSDFFAQGVGLGRLIFVLLMLSLTLFFYRTLNPMRGTLVVLRKNQNQPAQAGMSYAWQALAMSLPILAAILSIMGYQYTANTLVEDFVRTFWLVLVLISLHQFVVRWLIVIRGRLVLQAARDKRKAERQAAELEQEDPAMFAETSIEPEEQEVDINALSEDSLSLLNLTIIILAVLGAWMIWSDILPALGVFNQVTLYHHSIEVAGEAVIKSITLADVGQTILIVLILVLLVRRLPGFLEILLRQRKSVTAGSLYAIKSLTTYALIGAGIMLVFSRLGGAWSDFQWIIAALGVGIGFGLQEIVANFISGLIILFERPIRVGDVVTVGDISGTVTRIQIRATTIRDWDRKELLVPNKEFITGRLLNWSLSDSVTRLTTTIGVAYGSDVELAMRLIEDAAQENEMIIDTPRPDVSFRSFGDSTLNLSARVFIDNIDYRVKAMSDLHRAINKKFNEAGIVIAFPQRDVHLDTSQPLEVRLSP